MHSPPPATLADVLLNAASLPSPHALVTVHRDGSETPLSYPGLLARARGLLAALQAQGLSPGQAVLSQVGASARQLEVFWACVLGGLVPVLLPKVASWRRESEASRRLRAVCSLLGPSTTLLIDDDQRADHAAGAAALPRGMRWLCDPGEADATRAREHRAQPGDLAYLQLSSGSTGMPKGVRLTHANMLANLRDMAQAQGLLPAHGFLNWMPYYHDMGLVMFHLLPAYLGAGQVKLDAADFVADPLLWLTKIHQHRSAVVGGPNFGLRHVLDKLDGGPPQGVDLSCVRLWFNGAEPIWVPTMRAFVSRMAAAGLRPDAMAPAYGLAEATVVVSLSPRGTRALTHRLDRQALLRDGLVRDAAEGVEAIEYADVGLPLASTQVRVVGEDGSDLGEQRLGEVQVRGASVTSGYETRAEGAARECFDAEGWLRTGDLGFLRGGRLTITGRLKDVIAIHGRQVMAVDVEQHLGQLFGLKTGRIAACGVPQADGSEAVVLFVVARAHDDGWRLLHRLRAAAEAYLAHPVVGALPVRRIPHTSSGKPQRHPLARQWQLGAFAELLQAFHAHAPQAPAPAPANDGLVRQVVQAWSEALRLRPGDIGLDTPFTALGGGSVQAIQALALLERSLGRRLGTGLLIDGRTVRDTVACLERHLAPEATCAASADTAVSVSVSASAGACAPAQAPAAPSPAIAVIGMACRFPGAASPAQFWGQLRDGVSSIREVPAPPWMPEGQRLHMGRIDGIELFAADFFGLDDEEARLMDPQQRLMLEVGYEALDDAGYTGTRMPAQRQVGVYVGATHNAYLESLIELRRRGDFPAAQHPQLLPGNLLSIIAARLSQRLDLKGPALHIDTACASSLVALHCACTDLRSSQSEIALAGGVSLLSTLSMMQLLGQTGTLSDEGVCRVFDEAASGMVASEGLGLVVLKRLDQALADGDRIDAVISATAVTNDGHSIGLMAPTLEGQEAMLRQALAQAGLHPSQIGYVEAHGTGTPVGDAIEVHALTNVFGEPAGAPYCGIGSVKANIGHPMAAAGVAGLIKLLLSLRHGLLPPTLNLRKPHPNLRLEHTPFWPVLSAAPWPRGVAPRHAGISSFGFGGTNAHAIVSDAPLPAARARTTRSHHLLCLSARNREELLAVRSRLLDQLLEQPDLSMLDLSYTRCAGREAFRLRECLVVCGVRDAIEQLRHGPRAWPGDEGLAALVALGQRWLRGEPVDWNEHFRGSGARIVPLPTYPFTRRAYWLPGSSPDTRGQPAPAARERAGGPPGASAAGPDGQRCAPARAANAEEANRRTAPGTTTVTAIASPPAAPPPASPLAEDTVAHWIETELASHGIRCADRSVPFARLGADSLIAVHTCHALAARLGADVSMALFFEYASVERLARHLARLHSPSIERLLAEATTRAPLTPP